MILIGPKDGQRHCEPEPRYLEEECSDAWRLHVCPTTIIRLKIFSIKPYLNGGVSHSVNSEGIPHVIVIVIVFVFGWS